MQWFGMSVYLQECSPRAPHVLMTVPVLPWVSLCPPHVCHYIAQVSPEMFLCPPTGAHVSLGMSPVVYPVCLGVPRVSPMCVSLSPLCHRGYLPRCPSPPASPHGCSLCFLCDPRVSPHPPRGLFPLDVPTTVPMSFIGACVSPWMSPWMSLRLHAMCLCALAVPIGVPVSPPTCACAPPWVCVSPLLSICLSTMSVIPCGFLWVSPFPLFSPRTMPGTLELWLLLLALALRGEAVSPSVSPATSPPESPSETCGAALADVLRRLRELEGHVQALRGHCGDAGGPQAGTGNRE